MDKPKFCVVNRFEPLTLKEWLMLLTIAEKIDYLCYLWLAKRGRHCK